MRPKFPTIIRHGYISNRNKHSKNEEVKHKKIKSSKISNIWSEWVACQEKKK